MPELPEVETVRAYIERHAAGRTITGVKLLLPRLVKNASAEAFCHALEGHVLTAVSRKGKYLLLRLEGDQSLLVHLRMTGSLIYKDVYEEIRGQRIIFSLNQGYIIYRDIRTLGCVWLVPSEGPTGVAGYDTLGPDGNSSAFTAAYLAQKLQRTKRSIKSFLLDQKQVAGLGNIYVDEALFRAAIHPQRQCSSLSEEECICLHDAVQAVLQQGLEHGGTTIRDFINGNGQEGSNQAFLCVYGKEGTPCPHCGHTIAYMKFAGRGTHYCPHCQR